MRLLLTFLLLLPVFIVSAQLEVIFKNAKPIDKNRYTGIKGSSMMFENWTKAKLYDVKGLNYNDVLINYNGESNFLEAKKNDSEYIDVNVKEIPRAVIQDVAATGIKDLAFLDSLVLINGPNLKSKSTFHILLHNDEDKMLLLEFHAAINSVTDQLPGETVVRKTFNKKYKLVLLKGASVSKFFISQKKETAKQFEEYGDYIKWCKNNKGKPNQYESAIAFLQEHKPK
jgi:hypothetical protein